QMKAGGNVFINARQVPVAEELSDIGQLVAEAGQVNADFAQLTQHDTAPAHRPHGQIAIGPLQRTVQNPVVSLQLGQLQVGQLHHVERLVKVLRLVNEQGRVPVNDHQI